MRKGGKPYPQRTEIEGMKLQSKLRLWVKRVLFGLALLLGVLVLVSILYQMAASTIDARRFPPPGSLVDLGGRRMHLYCLGKAQEGVPKVILEAHSEGTSPQWIWVQSELAKSVQVCSYDRAGSGWSDPGPDPRDAKQVTGELHELLGKAGVTCPYVLVGHSLGGLYVRMYTSLYPEEVAGMVLLDAAHPDQFTRSPELKEGLEISKRLNMAGALTAPFGLMRVYVKNQDLTPGLPDRQSAEVKAQWASTKYWKSRVQGDRVREQTDAQVRATGSLGDLPLTIITAGEGSSDAWLAMQEELAELSTNSRHHILDGATHLSLIWDQENAVQVSQWILETVAAAR